MQNETIYGCRLKKIEVCGNSARAVSIIVTSSLHSVCAKKLRNPMDTYKLVSTTVNADVNVKVSSDAGKEKGA